MNTNDIPTTFISLAAMYISAALAGLLESHILCEKNKQN